MKNPVQNAVLPLKNEGISCCTAVAILRRTSPPHCDLLSRPIKSRPCSAFQTPATARGYGSQRCQWAGPGHLRVGDRRAKRPVINSLLKNCV